MRHFVVNIVYKVPLEQIEAITQIHRDYLQTGYKKGLLLLSGPKVPRDGGILIARSGSIEEIKDFCNNDPYALNDAAEHHIIEFNPKSHRDILNDWIT